MDKDNVLVSLNDQQFKQLVLEMLFKLSIEQDAFKTLIMNEYANTKDADISAQKEIDELNSYMDVARASAKLNLQVQLKNNYGLDQSVDDLLKSL